jgi:hypothetical protein
MAPATIATAHSGRISHNVSASRIHITLHITIARPTPNRTGIVAAATATIISCHFSNTFSPVHLDQPPLMMATAPKATQAHTMMMPSHMT